MYSSNPNDNQTYAPPSAPPPYGQPAIGIPAKPTNYSSQAPPPRPPHMQHTGPSTWSTGLCDCFDDPSNCCITCCCPCITFGQIAEIVDKGSPPCIASGGIYCLLASVTGFACLYSCFYRSKMRHHHMLPESPCNDCLVHCCCEACALCQEYRELQHRGFDMSLGWEENMGRQNRGVAMPPVAPGGMSR